MSAADSNSPSSGAVRSDEKSEYLSDLPRHNVRPLWTVMQHMVPPHPSPKAAIALWRYEEMRPLLLKAGQLVDAREAERRVLMLTNPALGMFSQFPVKNKLTGSL